MNHLFAQGANAAQLFKSDEIFRQKVNEKLPIGNKLTSVSDVPKDGQYEVVFAIVTEQ